MIKGHHIERKTTSTSPCKMNKKIIAVTKPVIANNKPTESIIMMEVRTMTYGKLIPKKSTPISTYMEKWIHEPRQGSRHDEVRLAS